LEGDSKVAVVQRLFERIVLLSWST